MRPAKAGRPRAIAVLVYLSLAIATVLTFSRVRENDFVRYDDPEYITANPHVQQGLTPQTVRWAFQTTAAANWHPLTWLSHLADVSLFGLNPSAHHWTNVALHALAALLLLGALQAMTGALWRSAFVAAAFALHPLRVESVAWASERKDVLGAVFWMLTMLAYALYARRPGAWRYAVVILALVLGLLSKPMLVTLPFVLLLLDIWPLRRVSLDPIAGADQARRWQRAVLEKLPLLALVAASSAVTIWAQHRGGAVVATERLPIDARVENALLSYVRYIGMTFWPAKLAVFYPRPGEIEPWQIASAAAVLAAITMLAIRWRRDRPYFGVGWFWYLGTLVPVIGIIQVGEQALADRYTYIPGIGLAMIAAWGAEELTHRLGRSRRLVLGVAGLAVAGVLAWRTWVQIGYWRDTQTLFEHAVAVTRGNYLAHDYLGTELSAEHQTDAAIEHFRRAIEIRPDYFYAHFNLANALRGRGDLAGAVQQYQRALEIRPSFAPAWNNLGIAFVTAGQLPRAAEAFARATKANPDFADAHANLGRALEALGQPQVAADEYRRALALDPHSTIAARGLARLRSTTRPAAATTRALPDLPPQ